MKNFVKLLCVIYFITDLKANAQNYLISFAGSGTSTTVSTIKVENLTKGTSLTLNGSDILRLTVTTGINSIDYRQSSELKIYPNPMTDNSTLMINPPIAGDAAISVYDMTGKLLAQTQNYLENSPQMYCLSSIKNGIYTIVVKGKNYQFSGKLLSNGKYNGQISIERINSISSSVKEKTEKGDSKGIQANVDMAYTIGDRLKFTGTSGNYRTIITDIPTSDKTINFNFMTCMDGDNNNYAIVEIGTQVWMAENLKTTKYNDGTAIPNVTVDATWAALTTGAYSDYSNTPSNSTTYGRLYNWYAVDNNAATKVVSNGGKNVCPTGWHVPTDEEWTTLENYLIANGYNYDGTTTGNKMAKALASTTLWTTYPVTGTVGNTDYPAKRNATGFTALPGGSREWHGSYNGIGNRGDWWSSTAVSSPNAWHRYMSYDYTFVYRYNCDRPYGLSVRCVRD
jgi:uncharacterized protein (TIGR02145 family)